MRRAKLVTFAAGAGLASVVFVASNFLVRDEKAGPVLTVADKEFPDPGTDFSDEALLSSAGFVRRCGLSQFRVHAAPSLHAIPYTTVELSEKNSTAINCILKESGKRGFPVTLSFETR